MTVAGRRESESVCVCVCVFKEKADCRPKGSVGHVRRKAGESQQASQKSPHLPIFAAVASTRAALCRARLSSPSRTPHPRLTRLANNLYSLNKNKERNE